MAEVGYPPAFGPNQLHTILAFGGRGRVQFSRREMLGTAAVVPLLAAGPARRGVAPVTVRRLSERRYQADSKKIRIPMPDGVELAAVMVYPANAAPGESFPAVFLYNPYRGAETDGRRLLGFFAEHGYYGLHIDVRGTGMSGGRTPHNEYSEVEQQDALYLIAWLASQHWCNGNVGIFGSSYSGFNAIQIGMLGAPALKAIVPTFATDDVYTDDIIYYDGALQCDSLGRWPFSMIASMGLPAAPDFNTDTEEARSRIEDEPWIFEMLRHQTEDAFWKRMSLRPDYGRLKVPTMSVGGWLDAYTDSVPRMLEEVKAPSRAIIGPWTHGMGIPGPAINIELETLRWWDQWLKGLDTGVLDDPRLALYANHSYRPSLTIAEIPGEWRYEDRWPPVGVEQRIFYPRSGELLSLEPGAPFARELAYKPTVGMTNRYRCPHNSAELPVDQRPDDDYSLCFNSPPLDESLEILGFPKARLRVSSTAPVANWIVRLCDVAPDGTSTLVTKGILNGCHHRSHEYPEALSPGRIYALDIDLKVISWRFPKGHRIRLAVGNADFPNLWPSPYAMTTSLHAGGQHPSQLILPVVPPGRWRPAPRFEPAEVPPGTGLPEPQNKWTVTRDEMAKSVIVFRETLKRDDHGGVTFERRWTSVSDDAPAVARLVAEGQAQRAHGADMLTCTSKLTIESDETYFHVAAARALLVNGTVKYSKDWHDSIKRNFV